MRLSTAMRIDLHGYFCTVVAVLVNSPKRMTTRRFRAQPSGRMVARPLTKRDRGLQTARISSRLKLAMFRTDRRSDVIWCLRVQKAMIF